MQERLDIPQDYYDVCKAVGVASTGNTAANAENFLDLTGQNVQPADLPGGFTARSIVALVFSCISAFVGIAFIIVYGMSDLKFRNDGNLNTAVDVAPKAGTTVEMTPLSGYHD